MDTQRLLALLLLTAASCQAYDPQVAAVQAALKEIRLYEGEITGTLDHATQAAVRRFQMLRDLRVTGTLDDATLERLRLPPPSMVASDQDFLNHNTPTVPPTVAEKREPPPPSVPPPTGIPEESIRTFLEYYLRALSSASIAAQLTYFQDPVDYHGHTGVSLEWLRSHLAATPPPRGHLQLVGIEPLPHDNPDQAVVRYEVRILPRSRRRSIRPSTERFEAVIARTPTGGLKFASLRKVESFSLKPPQ